MVFDKGFISYPWFRALGAKGVFFVTRLKRNAVCKLLEHRPVNRKTGVASDLITEVTSSKTVLAPATDVPAAAIRKVASAANFWPSTAT